MPLDRKVASFLRNLIRSRRVEADLDEEIRSHLEMLIEENISAEMSAREARRAARIELGGLEQVKEDVRHLQIGNWTQSVISDWRFGLRQLRRNPGFTAIVVLTLSLGIGASTAIFSMVNGVLLRPFPAPSPEQLAILAIAEKGSPTGALGFSYPQFSEFRKQAAAFCDVFGLAIVGPVTLTANDRTDQVALTAVTNNYFSGLGVGPAIGRMILPDEGETPG